MPSINLLPGNENLIFEEKKKNKVSVIIAFALIASSFLLYGILYFDSMSTAKKIESLDQEIEKADEGIKKEIENNKLLLLESKANDVKFILSKHPYFTNLVDILQNSLDEEVYFSSLNISYNKNQKSLFSDIKGIAKDYLPVSRQMAILRNSPYVKNIAIKQASSDKFGNVEFEMSLEWEEEAVFFKNSEK